jgi:predicted tellurium resistance membrane protein TerC
MEELLSLEGLVSLATLTFLEIVLGIDNIVFISIISGRLPIEQQGKARNIGIVLALVVRILMLLGVSWIIGLRATIFTIGEFSLSYRDLILIGGGLFLLAKSTSEMHAKLEGGHEEKKVKTTTFRSTIIQIVLLDLIFSLDSILTAVGLVENLPIIIIAIVISLGVMLIFSRRISSFINDHPTMKILGISFLLMIGMLLIVEGFHVHVPKGYIYFSMAFALGVEILNMKIRKNAAKKQVAK